MIVTIRNALKKKFDYKLVDSLIETYVEGKQNYYLGGLRLNAVEAGRFCEAAFRILEHSSTGKFTPIGTQLDTQKIIRDLESLPILNHSDSVRLHIPRALRVVYDIRNKRNAAHLADGIDPNLQDATLVVTILDWVLAEFVRLFCDFSANEAHTIVDTLVTKVSPLVEDFDGYLKVLPDLKASEHILLLLDQVGRIGASFDELSKWARPKMRSNLKRTLDSLTDKKSYTHFDGDKYYITKLGSSEVQKKKYKGIV